MMSDFGYAIIKSKATDEIRDICSIVADILLFCATLKYNRESIGEILIAMKSVVPRICLAREYRFEKGCELVIVWFYRELCQK